MSVLPDINLLLAYGWRQHPSHNSCSDWFKGLPSFALCPMSPAFRASYEGAWKVLDSIRTRPGASQLPCDVSVSEMPSVLSYKDTTDAYLVHLAKHHCFRFATLDQGILEKEWASAVAYNPIAT